MTAIEQLLARDFGALVRRLESDRFADAIISRMRKADRARVGLIGLAGALGAGAAASQFSQAALLIENALPQWPASGALAAFEPAAMIAALALAALAAATVAVLPPTR
jgi:hypothetical protein